MSDNLKILLRPDFGFLFMVQMTPLPNGARRCVRRYCVVRYGSSLWSRIRTGDHVETAELRPLSLGELLDRTFTLYRNNFWLFVGIMAVPAALGIPVSFLALQFDVNLFANPAAGPPSPRLIWGFFGWYVVFLLVGTMLY